MCGGGLAVLRRYGTDWFVALALKRWVRITAEDLDAMTALRRCARGTAWSRYASSAIRSMVVTFSLS